MDYKKEMRKNHKAIKVDLVFLFLGLLIIFFLTSLAGIVVLCEVVTELGKVIDNDYVKLAIAGVIALFGATFVVRYFKKISLGLQVLSLECDGREQIIHALENPVKVDKEEAVMEIKVSKAATKVASPSASNLSKEVKTNLKPTLACLNFNFIEQNTAVEAVIVSFNSENIIIPPVHNGFPVRIISSKVTDLEAPMITENVFLPKSIRTIAPNTFANLRILKSVVINEGVKTIGANAFLNCQRLTEVFLPESVLTCGANAFRGCPLLVVKMAHSAKPDKYDIMYKDPQTQVIYKAGR